MFVCRGDDEPVRSSHIQQSVKRPVKKMGTVFLIKILVLAPITDMMNADK